MRPREFTLYKSSQGRYVVTRKSSEEEPDGIHQREPGVAKIPCAVGGARNTP